MPDNKKQSSKGSGSIQTAKSQMLKLLRQHEEKDLSDLKRRFQEKLREIQGLGSHETEANSIVEEYEKTCHAASGIILRSRKISYLMTRDVMTPFDIAPLIRDTTLAAKKAIRELSKPALVKLSAAMRPSLPTERVTLAITALIKNELETVPARSLNSITPNPRLRSNIIPSNSTDLKILFLAANPAATSRLQLDEEVREIEQQLLKGTHRDAIKLQPSWATRIEDVFDALSAHRPKIVHFCGHSSQHGGIELVSAKDPRRPQRLNSSQLLELFTCFAGDVEVLVLNSCESASHAKALSSILACCIGYEDPVTDETATIFSGRFYSALANGQPLLSAFQQALALLKIQGSPSLPSIFFRPGFEPQSRKFITAKQEVNYQSLQVSLNNFRHEFFGRPAKQRVIALNSKISDLQGSASRTDSHRHLLAPLRCLDTSMEEIIERAKSAASEMHGLQQRWSQFLSQEALSRMAAFGDASLLMLSTLEGVPKLLKDIIGPLVLDTMGINNPGLNPNEYFTLAEDFSLTAKQFAATSVSHTSNMAIHFDKIIECLPASIEPTTERSQWQWP